MSITKRLILIFIIIIIFIILISFYFSNSFRIIRERTIVQNITVLTDEVLKRIDNNFQILVEDLFLYSSHDYLNSFFSKEKIKNNNKNIPDNLYVSEKLKERFFEYWGENRGYKLFNNVHIIDIDGNIVSSTDSSVIGIKINIKNILNELEKTKYYISEVFYDKKSNEYILSISVLIKNENGDNKSIIRADISILSFIKEVEIDFSLKLFEFSQLIIVCNKHKKIIFKSGSYTILEDVSNKEYFKNITSNTGYFKINKNNQKYIYSYAKKSVHDKWIPDWSVIIKNSEKELLYPLRNIVIRVYLIIFLLIIILSIFILFIIKSILSSVKNLQEGAKIIGKGNLDYKIKSVSRDELNDVVVSFNEMTSNIVKVTAKKEDLEKEIIKREKIEKILRESEKKLKEAQEIAHLGFWNWDIKTGNVEWSEEIFKIFCLDPEKYTPQIDSILSLLPWPDHNQRDQELIKYAAENHTQGEYEQNFLRPDKSIGYYHSTFQGVYDENGGLTSIVGTILDITERKKAENNLKQTLLNLDRSNKELEQFAYIASHDLQEPLRIVASYIQLLAKRYKNKLDKDADDFINYALEGAVRMQNLINSLLKYSRVTTGGVLFSKINCRKLIESILKLSENIIKENKAKITLGNLPVIYGDENQIFRVFQNLIHNAIKFKKDDTLPEIHISCKKEKNYYKFKVKDNGIGIDKKYFDMIFVIFKRLHSCEIYQGNGMGLTITKRIIERHGGTIWLESEPDKGTVFYFTIPINEGRKI